MRALLLLSFLSSLATAREVRLADGLLCVDTATTYLMRDTSSSCGQSTTFCTTPLSCFSASTRQYVGGGVVTCRAIAAASPGGASMTTNISFATTMRIAGALLVPRRSWLPTYQPRRVPQRSETFVLARGFRFAHPTGLTGETDSSRTLRAAAWAWRR